MNETVRAAITNATQSEAFARMLNMKLIKLEDGHSIVEMAYAPQTMNNMSGRAHGGALFGLIDEAFETASQTNGTLTVALNVNITWVANPRPGAVLRAEAKQVSQTKKTACYNIKITDQHSNVIAVCQTLGLRTAQAIPFL